MKKIILGLFLLTTIFAQDEITSKWSIYTGVTSMGVEDGDSRAIGDSYGIAYTVNKRLTIGMGYSGRGSKAKLNKYNAQDTFENLDLHHLLLKIIFSHLFKRSFLSLIVTDPFIVKGSL